jgi:hypothetical protein
MSKTTLKDLRFPALILAFSFSIPVITIFITLSRKPLYRSAQPTFTDTAAFAQISWQEKPVANLEHLLLFLEKPELYTAADTLHTQAPVDSKGYYILPRGAFYDEAAMLAPVQKIKRLQGKEEALAWIVHAGTAYPVDLNSAQQRKLQELVAALPKGPEDREEKFAIDAALIGAQLEQLPFWPDVKAKLAKFEDDLKNGKIDLTPRKKVSQFMNR